MADSFPAHNCAYSATRYGFCLLLAVLYFIAGVLHLVSPNGFLKITPEWVPYPEEVVAFTGIAEMAGAIGLLIPRFRYAAGIGLALYAICVYPANINHAVNAIEIGGRALSWNYHGPRLLLQPVFIWWALFAGGVTNWPFRNSQK
jgi:uncharacterized membrane protein